MLGSRTIYLLSTAWIALWLALLAPAMCQRHGLLYFHAAAPDSSLRWADDMCGNPSAPTQPSTADQHHVDDAFQTSLMAVFVAPDLMLSVEAACLVTSVALHDQHSQAVKEAPPLPPPRSFN